MTNLLWTRTGAGAAGTEKMEEAEGGQSSDIAGCVLECRDFLSAAFQVQIA